MIPSKEYRLTNEIMNVCKQIILEVFAFLQDGRLKVVATTGPSLSSHLQLVEVVYN